MGTCVSVWALLVGIERLVMDPGAHVVLDRIEQSFAIWIAVFYLHTVIHFVLPQFPEKKFPLLKPLYLATLGLAALVPTPLFIAGAKPQPLFDGRLYDVAGSLYFLFPLHYTVTVTYASALLIKASKRATRKDKIPLALLLWGTGLGFLLGATAFPLVFDIQIPPYGFHFVWLYTIVITYAIFRHQLWDIHVVIRKSLVYSILVTLLTAGYFGLVYGIEWAFRVTFRYNSIWLSLATFALMALVFQPLKISIQRLVDWLIFHERQEQLAKRMERLEEQALLSEKFKAVSTLAAGMAHEIKNPLTAIRTFAKFIPEKRGDPEFLDKLHQILTVETERIHGIVQDVLSFAKPRPPQPRDVDLGALIASTVNLLSSELLKKRVRWSVDCTHNGAVIHADPDQLRQVLINLIQNAADAMPAGGRLKIATRSVNNHLELTISDTGTGIPLTLLPKIFDPFVTTKPDGNGLGLAVVYSIIQSHRGSIRADSQPNHGTTFTVSLPL
jgi:signal transduction histidine kinase